MRVTQQTGIGQSIALAIALILVSASAIVLMSFATKGF
jgi:hypothetical protein